MITPQQVYDYLQENEINLGGRLDIGKNRYRPRFGLPIEINFVKEPYLIKQEKGMEYLPVGNLKGFKMDIAADRSLEEVSKSFVHEALHANSRDMKILGFLPIVAASIALAIFGVEMREYIAPFLGLSLGLPIFYMRLVLDEELEERYVRRKIETEFGIEK